jgi:F-type H+-transporting ATPase subunit epsilon
VPRAEKARPAVSDGKKLRLRVLAPYRPIYDDDVDYVILRSREGDAGILPGHEPYTAVLDEGILIYHKGSLRDTFVVLGGAASVLDDEITVVSEIADSPDRIKQTIKELADETARLAREEQKGSTDIQLMELGLRRALVRVDVSAYSIIKGREGVMEFDGDARDDGGED